MYKAKRFEELDGFVTNFAAGEVGAGWEKLVGGLEISAHDELTKALHPIAWVTNLTFEDRCEATCCPQCGQSMDVQWRNDNGTRVVETVKCKVHGEQPPTLNTNWFNRVYVIRGQEITARVLRLKHAAIVSSRDDKAPADCTIPLAAWKAKFESKGEETGIVL
jgi:Zn ribbon nucleic-acid-binding protein